MRYAIPLLLAITPVFIIQSTVPKDHKWHWPVFRHTPATGVVIASKPVRPALPVATATIVSAEQKCLATMIYGEARGESTLGQIAVAYTAVNRAVNKTVCKVVLAPKQYSIFNNNPALRAAAMSADIEPKQKNTIDEASWDQAVHVAGLVVRKKVADPTNGATHYVAYKSLKRIPKWTYTLKTTLKLGNHTFFKVVA